MSSSNNPNIYVMSLPTLIKSCLEQSLKGRALNLYEENPQKRKEIDEKLLSLSFEFCRKVSDELNETVKRK